MKLFSKQSKKTPGWLAICFHADGLYAAHVRRVPSTAPAVELHAYSFAESSSLPAVLDTLAKDLQVSRYQCTTLLKSGEYQLLSVDAPNVPPEELKPAIRWRVKDMIDYHIDDATIDVLEVPVEKNGIVRAQSMYAVAARNQLIQERQALFEGARVPLSVIDIPEMAQRNISALFEPPGRGIALLSFSDDGGLLTVSFAGELYLSRRLDITLSQLQGGDADQKKALYDRITLELQRSLDHFDRQYHFIAVAKLLLAPLGDTPTDLPDYLAANLYIPVEAINLDGVLDFSHAAQLRSPELQQRFFLTLGAALRYEEKVL